MYTLIFDLEKVSVDKLVELVNEEVRQVDYFSEHTSAMEIPAFRELVKRANGNKEVESHNKDAESQRCPHCMRIVYPSMMGHYHCDYCGWSW